VVAVLRGEDLPADGLVIPRLPPNMVSGSASMTTVLDALTCPIVGDPARGGRCDLGLVRSYRLRRRISVCLCLLPRLTHGLLMPRACSGFLRAIGPSLGPISGTEIWIDGAQSLLQG
jgi:hypothetical protein